MLVNKCRTAKFCAHSNNILFFLKNELLCTLNFVQKKDVVLFKKGRCPFLSYRQNKNLPFDEIKILMTFKFCNAKIFSEKTVGQHLFN